MQINPGVATTSTLDASPLGAFLLDTKSGPELVRPDDEGANVADMSQRDKGCFSVNYVHVNERRVCAREQAANELE